MWDKIIVGDDEHKASHRRTSRTSRQDRTRRVVSVTQSQRRDEDGSDGAEYANERGTLARSGGRSTK